MAGMRRVVFLATIGAALASASCGDVVRQGRAPVMLVINGIAASAGTGSTSGQFGGHLSSSVLTLVTTGGTCTTTSPCPTVFNDLGQAILSIEMKDIGTPGNPTTPSSNNSVTLNRVHVEYVRSDGRNTPGVDVPYPFDTGINGTIVGTTSITVVFELVRIAAKEESPLVELRTNGQTINSIANLTFYGTDQVGNVVTATGSISIEFGYFLNLAG